MKPYVAHNTPKIKVAPPKVPLLDLAQCEVNILDIVAPHHKKLRAERAKQAEKASIREAEELSVQEQRQPEETEENIGQQENVAEAEVVSERKEKEARE